MSPRWVETSRGRTGNEAASRADGKCRLTIISEAVMAMAEKFNTGQEVCLQIPSAANHQ
jgi:hypothetical protein